MTEELASIWEHIEELRKTLIKVAWVILIGTTLGFIFHQPIIQFLTQPLHPQRNLEISEIKTHRVMNTGDKPSYFEIPEVGLLKNRSSNSNHLRDNLYELLPQSYLDWEEMKSSVNLLILSPLEGFTTSLKVSFWLGFAITSPIWLFFIFQFIAPALHKKEKLLILPFSVLSIFFIFCGSSFAYLITIPIANDYFFSFNQNLGLNLWSFSSYIDYSLLLILSNAVAFEIFAIVLVLVHYGFLKSALMQEKRRHVIVGAFILGAILTPPDIPSQLLMAIPMIILYELTIFYAILKERAVQNSKVLAGDNQQLGLNTNTN